MTKLLVIKNKKLNIQLLHFNCIYIVQLQFLHSLSKYLLFVFSCSYIPTLISSLLALFFTEAHAFIAIALKSPIDFSTLLRFSLLNTLNQQQHVHANIAAQIKEHKLVTETQGYSGHTISNIKMFNFCIKQNQRPTYLIQFQAGTQSKTTKQNPVENKSKKTSLKINSCNSNIN